MKLETVKKFVEDKGYTKRAERYKIEADYFGIPEDILKDLMSFDRYLRTIFPEDEVGAKLEAEYHKPISQIIYEKMEEKILKQRLF